MIMPDGRILARNLTPAVAEILQLLNPLDAETLQRAVHAVPADAVRGPGPMERSAHVD